MVSLTIIELTRNGVRYLLDLGWRTESPLVSLYKPCNNSREQITFLLWNCHLQVYWYVPTKANILTLFPSALVRDINDLIPF
jgi:hypothetical protein